MVFMITIVLRLQIKRGWVQGLHARFMAVPVDIIELLNSRWGGGGLDCRSGFSAMSSALEIKACNLGHCSMDWSAA